MAARDVADNTQEISRLRWKKTLTLSVFFGSIAFMPLSCFTCCGAAALIRQETAQAVFGIAGMLAPFAGLVGLILMWSDRSRYGRSLDLALQADELGLTYSEQPARRELKVVKNFQVFREPTNDSARNCLAGPYEGASIVVMDYSCSWGVGHDAYVITQTAVMFEDFLPGVPDLILYPKTMFGKLAEALGLAGKPIKVPGEEKFNKKYGLYTEQGVKAADCFTSELTALCVQEGDLVLEVSDGNLLVYWLETDIKPADLQDRLATALEIARTLKTDQ